MSGITGDSVDGITNKVLRVANLATCETDIQIEVEHIPRNFFYSFVIKYTPDHNVTMINRRPNTPYRRAVIQYKNPDTFGCKCN